MGNWEVSVPSDYLKIPGSFNMAHAVCGRWVEEGRGDDAALVYGQERITFGRLDDRFRRVVRSFQEMGVGRGDTLVFRSHNHPEYVVAALAALRIGAVPVLSSSLLGPRELEHVVGNSDARMVLTTQERLEAVEEIRGKCPTLENVVLFDGHAAGTIPFSSLASTEPLDVTGVETSPRDVGFMVYTSGTTGLPKGIVHTHQWLIGTGDPIGKLVLKLRPDDLCWHLAEFSFMYSWGHGLMYPLYCGTPVYIHPERSRPEDAFGVIAENGITVLSTVPTAYRMMLAVEGAEGRHDLSRLRVCDSSGETLPPETFREWKNRFGSDILDGIGVSEAQKFCSNLAGEPIRPGSAGKVFPGWVVEIHDDEGRPLPSGEIGRVAVRDDGPGLFIAYRKMPEKWAENHIGSWYYTGDLASFDEDGYFWYVSRGDDLIKSRGYLISPKEVEETCMEHPGVLEAGVIGVPDTDMGQRIKACVVLKSGRTPGQSMAEEVRETLSQRIAPYKVPKVIEFLEVLPKTQTGKIKRKELRQRSEAEEKGTYVYSF